MSVLLFLSEYLTYLKNYSLFILVCMSEYRFDFASAVDRHLLDGTNFLKAKVRLVKPGVYSYLKSNGVVRQEAKSPEEIFSPKFLKSLHGLVVTDGHPYQYGGFVNSSNSSNLVKGVLLNPRIEDNSVVADEIIFADDLIQKIKSGEKVEVSLGLEADTILEDGFLDGQMYSAKQTNLRANHLAHVVEGRIGPDAKVLLDGIQFAIQKMEGSNMPENVIEKEQTGDPSWVKVLMDKLDKLFQIFSRKEEIVQDSTDKKGMDKGTDRNSTDNANANVYAPILKVVESKFDEALEREGLVEIVKAVLPDESLKGLSNSCIKKKLISNQFPEIKLDSVDVNSYFDASVELAKQKAKLHPALAVDIKNDDSIVAELKQKRLNLYKEGSYV